MPETLTLTLTTEDLDRAIEASESPGYDRVSCCLVAQAAKREEVPGFYSCGPTNLSTYNGLWDCGEQGEYTYRFDKGLYNELRKMLPVSLTYTR